MKFENMIFNPGPQKSPLQDRVLMEKLRTKKQNIIRGFTPDELSFKDVYPEADILKDLHETGTYQEIFDIDDTERGKTNAELASVFEVFILDQIYSNNWLGSGMDTVLCSRYDDIKNGVDFAINKKSTDPDMKNLVLGVDITYASNPEVIAKKMNRIKREIREGEVAKLKYFQDQYDTKYREIKIPKVVVGISEEEVNRLLRLWVSEDNKRNEKLQKDETANKILIQIIEQLTYFGDYATKFIRDNTHTKENINRKGIKKIYNNAVKYFSEVLIEKEIDHNTLYKEYDDLVHNQILKELK